RRCAFSAALDRRPLFTRIETTVHGSTGWARQTTLDADLPWGAPGNICGGRERSPPAFTCSRDSPALPGESADGRQRRRHQRVAIARRLRPAPRRRDAARAGVAGGSRAAGENGEPCDATRLPLEPGHG